MRNFVRKNMHLSCRPSIQQSKRRQALMTANMEEDHESDIPLDSEDGLRDDVLSDEEWDRYQCLASKRREHLLLGESIS